MPVVSAPVFGAVLGVGVQLYVNGVRKLPLLRDPWLHVLWAGAGASFGTWLNSFEERTEKDLHAMLAKRDEANKNIH
ncbi:Excitatory amino acid transporter 1 [Micractinium conductrix]|uniref:Excitatory amino acid transporter 1 n=1 Tax=Micractinium conductrix TaxID=554055 RepID=A0A2P6V3Y0_9CHLO|nr:Excitatory amino acid transporter 1 [Micractinium conductrix]|eukprot:PSC68777.1 Excitatory amino acid transporter 1 [Micractinium conductrix]